MAEEERILEGTAIAPGLAMGQAFVYRDVLQRDLEFYDIAPHQIEQELDRLAQATQGVVTDLQLCAERVEQEFDKNLAEVFRVHQQILFDPSLHDEIRRDLEVDLVNIEQVVKRVLHRWERRFREMSSEDLRSRADDISDLTGRLLHALVGIRTHSLEKMPEGSVLVARRLFPSDTVFLYGRATRAVVVKLGGPGSHAALLARKMDIPTVITNALDLDQIATGDPILVDGFSGRVVLNPSANTKAISRRAEQQQRSSIEAARKMRHHDAITRSGKKIEVLANVGSAQDCILAADNGADGIGLFRIEQVYLTRKILPDEDELLQEIEKITEPFADKPVCVRLLDLGGDKDLPFLNLPKEHDSFLGVRGVRVLFRYPQLLRTQLTTFLRLAKHRDIRILVPMITTADDMLRVREMLATCAAEMGREDLPPLGAMIETPAAALCVPEISKHADFVSIGTNDLTQYTMAAGRENPSADEYFMDDHPAVIRLVQTVINEAGKMPVSLCGELASKVENIGTLLDMGLSSMSVSPPQIPRIKQAVRNHSDSRARQRHARAAASSRARALLNTQ